MFKQDLREVAEKLQSVNGLHMESALIRSAADRIGILEDHVLRQEQDLTMINKKIAQERNIMTDIQRTDDKETIEQLQVRINMLHSALIRAEVKWIEKVDQSNDGHIAPKIID